VSAKLIFFIVAAAIAIGSAVLVGLTVAVIGLSIKMPAADLITLTAGAATATFAAAVALASMAANLFFNGPEPPSTDHSPIASTPPQNPQSKAKA
jgi:hypothetical protein